MTLKLEFPNIKHKDKYEELIKEWWKVEGLEEISPWRLFSWNNFKEFLENIINDIDNSVLWVNAHLFFLVENNVILWAIQIRHHINHPNLIEKWWHIWYWIAPQYRRKWYATKMLKLWLIEAKKLWLDKVLITCDINNIGSKKVIEKNWWVFERLTSDWKMNRFWVNL